MVTAGWAAPAQSAVTECWGWMRLDWSLCIRSPTYTVYSIQGTPRCSLDPPSIEAIIRVMTAQAYIS